jgi:hypothetical protein
MVEPRILDAFQTMWGPFPEPVMLIHKDRTVLAVNDLARKFGIPTGIKCHSLNADHGADGNCRKCKANVALRTGETVCTEEIYGDTSVRGYWMPLKEAPEVYVHFGIGTARAMAQKNLGSLG